MVDQTNYSTSSEPSQDHSASSEAAPSAQSERRRRFQLWPFVRYWFSLVGQPLIGLAVIIGLVLAFGYAQQLGFFQDAESTESVATDESIDYFCPMWCVPPVKSPGRCPVCGMELKARKVTGDPKDFYGLTISPAARRLSNIRTTTAVAKPLMKEVRALGTITWDETSESTIPAWIDGRLDELFIDYTGAQVEKGEPLALLYSSELYSAQVELLTARKALNKTGDDQSIARKTNQRIYESARRRLAEFGVPNDQIAEIERRGEPESQITIVAPISGTVVEKLVDEGKYVEMGTPILRVVDLSKVWLMLEVFPEDASLLRYGQQVDVTLNSQPGKTFQGRVAFIDPTVDAKTRTVSVRVVIPNESRLIRIGDFARASLQVHVNAHGEGLDQVYDPQLAGKWVSPVHPWIIRDESGKCPECGTDLVPAAELGYVDQPPTAQRAVVVPRQAVLISGEDSIAYVETEPGRFEFRRVEVGTISGEEVAVVSGIEAGENIVSNATFMVDTAFNMSGKPSIIDPDRAPLTESSEEDTGGQLPDEIRDALTQLSDADRALAEAQEICPVTEFALGSMGIPIKVDVNGNPILLCCEGCRQAILDDPDRYLAVLDAHHQSKSKEKEPALSPEQKAEIDQALSALSPEDRALAEAQQICPVGESPLGSMGTPLKVDVNGRPVFICCEGCRSSLLDDPEPYLAVLSAYHESAVEKGGSTVDPDQQAEIDQALSALSPEDRALAEAQKICPVAEAPLGSMGTPLKVDVNGRPVFICCEGCRSSLLEDPEEYLSRLPDPGLQIP